MRISIKDSNLVECNLCIKIFDVFRLNKFSYFYVFIKILVCEYIGDKNVIFYLFKCGF